jgi:calcium-dependent protein kinase
MEKTAYFVAPETIIGVNKSTSDIWALGVILFVMLSGAPPFLGQENLEILKSVADDPLELPY